MPENVTPSKSEMPIVQLLPNLLTLAAICAGLTSIRLGFHENFTFAVLLILAACILDGVDGRLARLLNCESPMGAELDSLADFLNFGVQLGPGLGRFPGPLGVGRKVDSLALHPDQPEIAARRTKRHIAFVEHQRR